MVIDPRELRFSYARSSGPGGQNVNKVNSKAILRWSPQSSSSVSDQVKERFIQKFASKLRGDGDIVISSDRYRDQARNIEDCKRKLHTLLELVSCLPKTRKPTKVSRATKERRLAAKRRASDKKRLRTRHLDPT